MFSSVGAPWIKVRASGSGTKIIWTNLQGQMMLRSIANIISNNFPNQVSLISTIVFPFYYPIINIHPSKIYFFTIERDKFAQ